MKVKLKTCSGCGKDKPIWKNHEGEKYCQSCWRIYKPKKEISDDDVPPPPIKYSRIKQKSTKRSAEDIVYSQLRFVFMNNNPFCEARLKGCTHKTTDVHHKCWGDDRANTYLIVETWAAVCRTCHDQIHGSLSSEEAIALGLKITNYV